MEKRNEEKMPCVVLQSSDGDFYILPQKVAESFAVSPNKTDEVQALFKGDVQGQGRNDWTLNDLISLWEEHGSPQPAFDGDKLVGLKFSFQL